jgi:acyl dehydratase
VPEPVVSVRTVPLDPSYAGRCYPPTAPYAVSREKIREFAEAIGDANPAYVDPDAARALGHPDVVAPPTFPTVLALRSAAQVVEDPALGLDYGRVVHGEERYTYLRPIRAGDVLTVTMTIEAVRSVGGNDMLTLRGDVRTVAGEPVVTARSVLVARAPEVAGR